MRGRYQRRRRFTSVVRSIARRSEIAVNNAVAAWDGSRRVGVTTSSGNARRIPIPTHTWKIVVFVPTGEPLATATDHQIEAVLMPNIAGIENDAWSKYKTTVASIEAATGYTFPSLH